MLPLKVMPLHSGSEMSPLEVMQLVDVSSLETPVTSQLLMASGMTAQMPVDVASVMATLFPDP
jgi:hypothetical protein